MNFSNEIINAKLNEILSELENPKFLVNPFFRASKAIPEKMLVYKKVFYKKFRYKIFIWLIISPLLNSFKLTLGVILSLTFSYQYKFFNRRIIDKQCIFISHGIGENIGVKGEDQFFGDIPQYLISSRSSVGILYTNHFRRKYIKKSKAISQSIDGIGRAIIPKFLKPSENIEFISTILSLSHKCLFHAIKSFKKDPIKSFFLIQAFLTFFNRSTYANYLINQRINEILTKSKKNVACIVLTLEGQSYEQYVIESVFSENPQIKFVMYQHSPIVREQFGLENFLKSNTRQLSIFTTGPYYTRRFQEISRNPSYVTLGTIKANFKIMGVANSKRTQILFAPEGSAESTIEFIELACYLCDRESSYIFRIRLHPNLQKNLKIKFKLKVLEKKSNLSLSFETLSNDLNNSKYVFYRSSAVGIESLKFGAIPIFFGTAGQRGLDALDLANLKLPFVSSSEEALSFLENRKKISNIKNHIEIFNEYFADIDYAKLEGVFGIT